MHHFLEEAAIGGDPDSRRNLAAIEWKSGRLDRGVKLLIKYESLKHFLDQARGLEVSTDILPHNLQADLACLTHNLTHGR